MNKRYRQQADSQSFLCSKCLALGEYRPVWWIPGTLNARIYSVVLVQPLHTVLSYPVAAQWLRGGNNPKQKIIKNCQFFSFIPFSKAIVTRSTSLLSQNLLKSTYNIQQFEMIIIFLRFRKKFRKFNTSYIDIIDTIFYIWYSFSHFEIFLRYQIIIS